jgi:glycosyltransferase involved in cell wall biosynthesis
MHSNVVTWFVPTPERLPSQRTIRILGTRGVPAAHGGFETFAERLSIFLVERGWRVTVYCQENGRGPLHEDAWNGVQRVLIPVDGDHAASSVLFDWKAIGHAAGFNDLCLTLGYNTAVFCARLRVAGVRNVINMDGIEWHRAKWGPLPKAWFWFNEHAGCRLGDHLVADHPEISLHLQRNVPGRKVTMIPYGADRLADISDTPLAAFGLERGRFLTLIARPEPENSVLEVVRGFSQRPRGLVLAVLGAYREGHPYHAAVRAAAGSEVRFLGAIYDQAAVQSLRAHSAIYVHGHQVGGTNPSLVEALGAGNAVIAHDNRFNRWVAAEAAQYFRGAEEFAARLEALLGNPAALGSLRLAAVQRHAQAFTWPTVLSAYEELLTQWLPDRPPQR